MGGVSWSRLISWKMGVTTVSMSKLIRFSLPLLVGNLAQQLYNTVDSIVVGKYVGDTAMAAVAFLTRSEAWPRGNPKALCASLLISWVLAMVMTVIAHRKGAWRRRLPQQL